MRESLAVVGIVFAYLELASLLILGQVAVRLEGGVGGEPDILEVLLADWVLPVGQPCDCLVMPYLRPLLAGVGVLRNRLPLACCIRGKLSYTTNHSQYYLLVLAAVDFCLPVLIFEVAVPCCFCSS